MFEWSRDAHGIPQIQADSLRSVYEGMGYCHAADRGMQMLMMRILGWGRAAELLADDDEMVEVDRFFRRMNFSAGVDAEVDKLEPEVRDCVDAYCEGVNRRLGESVPFEMRLLRYRPTPWTIQDSLMLARMTGYLTLAQSQGEVERLFVEMVQAGIPDERLEELFPGSTSGLERKLLERCKLHERIVPDSVRWLASGARVMASNNWCVRGDRTKSGAAMLANDPHLETNRLPNVWVELSFTWPEGSALLATMPGLPAPLVGRNSELSWGATYTFMDAIDSWIEHFRDGTVKREDDWVELQKRVEIIKRKSSADVEATFWESSCGVLDQDPTGTGFCLATRWSGSIGGAASINALHQMWGAKTVDEGMNAFGQLEPSFNWIFADSHGDIGYQMSGRQPVRAPDWNGFAPRQAWDSRFAWRGFVPPDELPRVKNPDDGIIITANQDLNHLGESSPINMPMGDYRARRIRSLLEERDDHDVASFAAIQMDDGSIQADEFLELLEPLLDDSALGRALSGWDRRYDTHSVGATAFEQFYKALICEVFSPTVGDDVLQHLMGKTGTFIDFYQNFDRILVAEESAWFDGRSRDEIWRTAYAQAASKTSFPAWGTHNQIVLTNMLLGGKLPKFFGFDHGPYAIPGGRATPHQGQIYMAGDRPTSFIGSLRFVADMAEPTLHTALCGGPSDRRFSRWYVNGVQRWLRNELISRRP